MNGIRILFCLTTLILSLAVSCVSTQAENPSTQRELAHRILADEDLSKVLVMARDLIGTGMRAGEGYREV